MVLSDKNEYEKLIEANIVSYKRRKFFVKPHKKPEDKKRKGKQSDTKSRQIFIKNLPPQMEEYELEGLVSHFGEMDFCNIVKSSVYGDDNKIQKKKVCGFIQFKKASSAEKAILAEKLEYQNILLTISRIEDRADRITEECWEFIVPASDFKGFFLANEAEDFLYNFQKLTETGEYEEIIEKMQLVNNRRMANALFNKSD